MSNVPKPHAPPADPGELLLMKAAAIDGHRRRVAAESGGECSGVRATDARLAELLADPRLVILVVSMARRVTALEAALAARGVAA